MSKQINKKVTQNNTKRTLDEIKTITQAFLHVAAQ